MKNNQNKYFDHAFFADFVIVYMKMIINFPTFLLDIFLDYHGLWLQHIRKVRWSVFFTF